MRALPLEAAKQFVEQYFPGCLLAVLGGSASDDDYNSYSDLDIVIVEKNECDFYRKVFFLFNWIIECTVLTPGNFREMFDKGILTANPSLQRMVAEGIILKQSKRGLAIRKVAEEDLAYGPMPWSISELEHARYTISDYVADLQGANQRVARWFIAHSITSAVCEFILRANNKWLGVGKHLYKGLAAFSPSVAARLEGALEALYVRDDFSDLVLFCEELLEPYGGMLMEGYEE